jgi:hypothetical protein
LLKTINLRINVSSGGLIGKTRRLLEPLGLGAQYGNLFDAPQLILLLQMASRLEKSKGVIPDDVAYYTWGCGNGAVVGTEAMDQVLDYYKGKGIMARLGGFVTGSKEIVIGSRALDSMQQGGNLMITHNYTEKPLG